MRTYKSIFFLPECQNNNAYEACAEDKSEVRRDFKLQHAFIKCRIGLNNSGQRRTVADDFLIGDYTYKVFGIEESMLEVKQYEG